MSLNTDYLTTLANDTATKLSTLWVDIGLSDSEQQEALKKLCEDVAAVYNAKLDSEDTRRKSLEDGIAKKIETIRETYNELGEAAPAFPERESLTLLSWDATMEPLVYAASQRKKERLAQIEQLVTRARALSHDLGKKMEEYKFSGEGSISVKAIDTLEGKIADLEEEKKAKLVEVAAIVGEISDLFDELDVEQSQDDDELSSKIRSVIGKDPSTMEVLGVSPLAIGQLEKAKSKLIELRSHREQEITRLAKEITALWDRLTVSDDERQAFFGENSGLGPRVVKACEAELSRLQELKKEQLKKEIINEQTRLTMLWDELKVDRNTRQSFAAVRSEEYTDETMETLRAETKKLDDKIKVLKPIMSALQRREEIIKEEKELEEIEADASRLLSKQRGVPGRLLREEKLRNAVNKELPKLVKRLRELIPQYENENGQLFMVAGNRYLEVLEEEENAREQRKKDELEKKKESRKNRQIQQKQEELAAGTPLKTPKNQSTTKGRTPATQGRPNTAPAAPVSAERLTKSANGKTKDAILANIPVNRC